MRAYAVSLTPLLLLGGLRAQEDDPAAMVAQIFEESRPLAQALWRDYQAATADEDFSGQASDLPGWPNYVEQLDEAATLRFAADFVPNEDASRFGYALLAMNVAMGWLYCEHLPERQLVRIGSTQDPPDPEWDPYVRVVLFEDGTWRLASWPPARLEDIYSHREKFPNRLALTVVQEPDGFRLECRGTMIADLRDPGPQRWERFDRYLQDVVWPFCRIGEKGESLEGVLIRVPAHAPVTALQQVLARLGQPGRRVPDVQLWVTGGDFPSYYELDQRGAWGEDLEVMPLRMPPEFRVADALEAAQQATAIQQQAVAFVLPWQGPEPDPALWITELDQLASPICSQFWRQWQSEHGHPGFDGLEPNLNDPGFLLMIERLAELLEPHRGPNLPMLAPEAAAWFLQFNSMRRVMPSRPFSPGEAWMVASSATSPDGVVVRLVHRTRLADVFGGEECWLQCVNDAWTFCSWPRSRPEHALPRLASAPDFHPQIDTLRADLLWDEPSTTLQLGPARQIIGASASEFAADFEAWMVDEVGWRFLKDLRELRGGHRHHSLTVWAHPTVDQFAMVPILNFLSGEDLEFPTLRLQVELDETGRPGEVVFDQSVLRPGAEPAGSTGIRLRPGRTVQELCDELDRQYFRGATRFHLLPPE